MERLRLTDISQKLTEGFRRIPKPSIEDVYDVFTGIPSWRKDAESLPPHEPIIKPKSVPKNIE